MISVGKKQITERLAVAQGTIYVGKESFTLIQNKLLPKGDVLSMCEIVGIQGAKNISTILPLCHPLNLDHVELKSYLNEKNYSIDIYCKVAACAKTGVEMEALSGVNSALLSIYDLTKMINPNLEIGNIKLLLKIGGKSGIWLNPNGVPPWILKLVPQTQEKIFQNINISIITLSDRAYKGVYEDKSGRFIKEYCTELGATITKTTIIPDNENILTENILSICLNTQTQLIITTGGTGLSNKDITPETIEKICTKMIPGIGELLRQHGAQFTQHSWSSRSCAGIYQKTLIISLPGSMKAVEQGLQVLTPLIPHFIKTIDHTCTLGEFH